MDIRPLKQHADMLRPLVLEKLQEFRLTAKEDLVAIGETAVRLQMACGASPDRLTEDRFRPWGNTRTETFLPALWYDDAWISKLKESAKTVDGFLNSLLTDAAKIYNTKRCNAWISMETHGKPPLAMHKITIHMQELPEEERK